MSSRAPIQVNEFIKQRLDKYKESIFLSAKSASDVLERLMDFYERTEREREQEKARQKERMIDLGPESKKKLEAFRDRMGIRNDADAVELLLSHFGESDKLGMNTFDLFRTLQRK